MTDPVAEKLLAAATALIAEKGFAGLRLRDVAKRARVALGTPSFKFTDRDGLLRAALERAIASHQQALDTAHEAGRQLAARKAGFMLYWARVENALLYPGETLLRANAVYSSAVKGFRERVGRSAEHVGQLVLALVQRLHAEGDLHAPDVQAQIFFAQQFLFSSFAIAQSAALGVMSGEDVSHAAARQNVAASYEALFGGAADTDALAARVQSLLR